MMDTEIELTAKEAKNFESATGMHGFAVAQKLKARAKARASALCAPVSLVYKGRTLYVAPAPKD